MRGFHVLAFGVLAASAATPPLDAPGRQGPRGKAVGSRRSSSRSPTRTIATATTGAARKARELGLIRPRAREEGRNHPCSWRPSGNAPDANTVARLGGTVLGASSLLPAAPRVKPAGAAAARRPPGRHRPHPDRRQSELRNGRRPSPNPSSARAPTRSRRRRPERRRRQGRRRRPGLHRPDGRRSTRASCPPTWCA
jgi:hypothetical protein